MFINCLFLLLFINIINADFGYPTRSYSRRSRFSSARCPMPDNDNIVTRMMQRGKFAKFSCHRGYTMMGNKYATCRDGEWDVPLPICIKPGCSALETVKNSVNQTHHNGAWVLYFCLPRHNLVGSPVVYCDGHHWNSTAPKCVDSTAQTKISCDFEQDLCDWKQDELHDFDWRRINTKTPSSFMNTGPSYDHTLGKNGNGYYMYIESTSRAENDTARLISPVYDESLTKNGCFVFYYHMYGRHIGGLRVYQKPDGINLQYILSLSMFGKNKYLLFEKWGNQGDFWFTSVSPLLNVSDDFQIVIEGIRGNGFISDIAIDDVAILQGENCTNLVSEASTPPPQVYNSDSCAGRCEEPAYGSCSCEGYQCIAEESCCPDYIDICLFGKYNDDYSTTMAGMPQTQKLIASPKATNTTNLIPFTTTSSTLRPPTKPIPTTTTSQTTSTTVQTTSTTVQTTSTTSQRTLRPKTEKITPSSTKIYAPTTPRVMLKTTIKKPVTPRKPTTRVTTRRVKPQTTESTTTTTTTGVPIVVPTKRTTPRVPTVLTPSTTRPTMFTATVKSPGRLTPATYKISSPQPKAGSKGAITAVIVLIAIVACCGVLYGGYYLRTSSGSAALARLRGRTVRDPEVRFLKSDVDDIDDE